MNHQDKGGKDNRKRKNLNCPGRNRPIKVRFQGSRVLSQHKSEMQEPFQELNAGIVAADDTLTDGITEDEFLQFRQKCHRFRVLVIGSSDVGKTTLLERFTGDSIDRAQIKSPNGELVRIIAGSLVTARTCLNTRSFSFTSHLKKMRR